MCADLSNRSTMEIGLFQSPSSAAFITAVSVASDDAMSEAAASVRLYGLMDRHAGKVFPQILASPFVRDL